MVDCVCGFGKDIPVTQSNCSVCGTDVTPLHRLHAVPTTYLAAAMRQAGGNKTDSALQLFAAAIALGEHSPDAYLGLGDAYFGRSLFEDAVSQYDKGLALHPAHSALREARDKAIEAATRTQRAGVRRLGRFPQSALQVITLSLAMFMVGLAVAPQVGFLRRQEVNASPDYEKLISSLSDRLSGEPALHVSQLRASRSGGGITISGTVPTDVHRSLVAEIAKHVVPDGVALTLSLVLPEKPEVPQSQTYVVKPGDRLASLAAEWYGDARLWRKIFDANRNRLSTPDTLKVGQELVRPQ